MQCKMENGKLKFEGEFNYVLDPDPAWPDDPEKIVVEYMVVEKILNNKASGSGWATSVSSQLTSRLRQLEYKLMEIAKQNIKLKELK